ncbi:hypothetical protein LTR36_009131 [Oleoguttula mirabilis]|uniref:Vacuolar membrane-associated protein IML1 n=1 Tax=Oleoguttula mirabilis TaxID=1507867 RepID=A0AAV9J707_9PEZI|nr:hypothetical protein LTR36_009131 [Oleoguttula mirabilis]
MATEQLKRPCTVVLHDDRISQDDVLCGAKALPVGFLAHLSVAGAKRLCLVAKATAANPDEISVHVSLAQRFGFENRVKGTVEIVEDYGTATATHVELFFRDQHLSRADMWRIMQRLDGTVMHKGQQVSYLGAVAAEVEEVYIAGQNVGSAYVSQATTKPIFRSGNARYTILIQISKEMLEQWVDGELMYERVLSGYLPELFRRWDTLKVRHRISVVLFGRTTAPSRSSLDSDKAVDFFHVVATDVPSAKSSDVIRQLKAAFNGNRLPRQVSFAANGNTLEALHMAAMDFANDNIDPHLSSTGASIIAITAGVGLFETKHDMLQATTRLLMGNSIGVDIVALSSQPLHPVPLFSYQRDRQWEYALPHWVEISFWERRSSAFAPKWNISTARSSVEKVYTQPLRIESSKALSLAAALDSHDELLFSCDPSATKAGSNITTPTPEAVTNPTSTARPTIRHGKALKERPNEVLPAVVRTTPVVTPTASSSLNGRAKREALPPHALMASGRKISLGPKGLAPSRAVASTTVTAEHAQQGKDAPSTAVFPPNEASSSIAKEIRRTLLLRKTSQLSLASQAISEPAETTRPIAIGLAREVEQSLEDPVSIIEKGVMATVSESELAEDGGLSETPRAKLDPLYVAMKAAEAEGNWKTSPWLTLLNPSNPKRSNMRVAVQYRKWQHVFPKAISTATFKWLSMCSPAALPLTTEYRPPLRELERCASKAIRRLLVSPSKSVGSAGAQHLLEQLIRLRLTYGFQQASSDSRAVGASQPGDRDRFLMSLGNVHHELRRLSDAEIQVVEYRQQSGSDELDVSGGNYLEKYPVRLRTLVASKSVATSVSIATSKPQPDWSKLDEQLITDEQALADQTYSMMRFVLIPVEPPRTLSHGPNASVHGLSDEERRIDGIQKLTQLWQRNRWVSAEDQRHHASLIRAKTTTAVADRDPNPLAIEYQTRDPSAVVNALGPSLTGELSEGEHWTPPLFAESEMYHSSDFDVTKLVKQMQEAPPHGVEVRDRRWLARLHFKCFRGDELVNWLLRVFSDLHSREDAIAIGNELMKKRGIFTHVRHRHDFRDGNYFYQIAGAHRTTEYPDTASVFGKASLRSMPITPMVESRNSPMMRAAQIGSPVMRPTHAHADSDSSGKLTPTTMPADKKKLLLSQMMRCNVDPAKKSDQLEVVSLHYDRIHNPDNCYHIQLEWVTTTAKLIRDAVGRWAALVENHGLRLVQVPLAEACKLSLQHPFDQPVSVKLAVPPPETIAATPVLDARYRAPRMVEDVLGFQKALLRKMDFVLDYEAAASFTTKLDVTYSYGRPEYDLTQFVHKSGSVLAQISGDEKSDFLLLPNRLASQRPAATGKQSEPEPVENIVGAFTKLCHDEAALKAFYSDLLRPRMLAHSPLTSESLGADSDVPPIQLPPHLLHRAALKGLF